MAKSGTIIATVGAASDGPVVAAIAESDPLVATLGKVAVEGLKAFTTGLGIAILDTKNRKVHLTEDVTAVRTAITAADSASGITGEFLLEPDSTATPLTGANFTLEHAEGSFSGLDSVLAAQFPVFSVQTLLQKIEDAMFAANKDAIIIVDQANEQIRVLWGAPSDVDAAGDTLAAAVEGDNLLATFDQNVESVSGPRPFGE